MVDDRTKGGAVARRTPSARAVEASAERPEVPRRRPRYARWRALSLSLVYVAFALHFAHWRITGKTLAPLELNEVMYTLELGIITAGFLFMGTLVLGTLLFGRFFCSWACHIMVLQDVCGWLLRKCGIKPRPVRSRLLLLVPPLTALYMFLWPQIVRAWRDMAVPTFHFRTDADGWSSFITHHFWRNLPGPWVMALTFIICGFVIVYVLGSRSFCTYVCPYGAVFALADRFSFGRIRLNGDCKQCGRCTAACTSAVRVHEEINRFGMVVNPACLKDLDCVSACPQNAIGYGRARPALFKSWRSGRFGLAYDFSVFEEALAAGVFVIVLLAFRGLYGQVPFLLSLALGTIVGYLSVLAVRMFTSPEVRLATLGLRQRGRMTRHGAGFVVGFACLGVFVGQSAYVRYHEYNGLRQVAEATRSPAGDARRALSVTAHAHLLTADHWGLLANERVERSLVDTSLELARPADAETYALRVLTRHPGDLAMQLHLGRALASQDREEEAQRQFLTIIHAADPANASSLPIVVSAYHALGSVLAKRERYEDAAGALLEAVRLAPDRAAARAELGTLLAELGRVDEAIAQLREAVRLDGSLGRASYNLGTLLAHQGDFTDAVSYYERAEAVMPPDADLCNNLGFALQRLGDVARARRQFERAVAVDPGNANAHFNLGRLLVLNDQASEGEVHLLESARLDERFARLLRGP